MIVDTSVWVEYLIHSGSAADRRLERAIVDQERIVVPEVVRMELLIGGTDDEWAAVRRRFIDRFEVEALSPGIDTEAAADVHRRCRRGG
ncbi:MAG TPA: PIN domain-containing protein, partial [Acidimicrobiales bacterium]